MKDLNLGEPLEKMNPQNIWEITLTFTQFNQKAYYLHKLFGR